MTTTQQLISTSERRPHFALFESGPLRLLTRRLGWARPKWDVRVLAFPMLAWLPMLVLSLAQGRASSAQVSFFTDLDVQARFLVSLPLLLWGEGYADRALTPLLSAFVEHGIVREHERERFRGLVLWAERWSRSIVVFVFLVGFVTVAGPFLWQRGSMVRAGFWYAVQTESGLHLTWAGAWYSWVAVPIFQFFLCRWALRLLLWWALLFRVSRLDLHLVPTDPDHAGGLGFLGHGMHAFVPYLLAQGALVSGLFANRIFYGHRHLQDFWQESVVYAALVTVLVLGPLTAFTPRLIRAKRDGRLDYGRFAARYVDAFDRKWTRSASTQDALGSADIQSLADLANGTELVERMRIVPFGKRTIVEVVLPFALPILPLLFTTFPVGELVIGVLKIVLS